MKSDKAKQPWHREYRSIAAVLVLTFVFGGLGLVFLGSLSGVLSSKVYEATCCDLVHEFEAQAAHQDARFHAIVRQARKLQHEAPERPVANLLAAAGTNDLWPYFPKLRLPEAATNLTLAIVSELERRAAWRLVSYGTAEFVLGIETNRLRSPGESSAILEQAVEKLQRRLQVLRVKEANVAASADGHVTIRLPGLTETEEGDVASLLGVSGRLEFRAIHPDSQPLLRQGVTPADFEAVKARLPKTEADGQVIATYLVKKQAEPGLEGVRVSQIRVTLNRAKAAPAIEFSLQVAESRDLEALTPEPASGDQVPHRLAMLIDGKLWAAVQLTGEATGYHGVLDANLDWQTARELATVLEHPLPVPLQIVEHHRFRSGAQRREASSRPR